jgi:ribose 5-phosphate isomerase A
MTESELKRQAAFYTVDTYVKNGMRVGLGHGSTMAFALERLAQKGQAGELEDYLGVPVSEQTAQIARSLRIPLTTLEETPHLDLCIDGADEVDPQLNLIKGLGGALLREKIVAYAAAKMVVMVDESKVVDQLGTKAPLPVEVLPFGWNTHTNWLRELDCQPEVRRSPAGALFVTDGGNYIYDCFFANGLEDPAKLEIMINSRPGIVENGLFVGIADEIVVSSSSGEIQVRSRRVQGGDL